MRFSRLSVFIVLSAALHSGSAYARPVWYVGLAAGRATVSYAATLGAVYNRVHDHAYAYALQLGYRPVKYLGMEAAYHDYGRYGGTATSHCPPGLPCSPYVASLTGRLAGWSFLLMPQLPVGYGLTAFIEGGVLHWSMKGLIGSSPAQVHSGTDALYGGGLRYDFPSHISLKVSFQHTDLHLNETSVGAEWRF